MVSGSCAWTSIGKPKSVGRFPLTSCHCSPALSERITSQCFCMNRTPGRDGVNRVRIRQRRLEVPDAFELPRMLRAVVPFVGAHLAFIDELVALAFGRAARARQLVGIAAGGAPGLAAVFGALDDLTEPAAGLGRIDAVGIDGRAFEMIDLPP